MTDDDTRRPEDRTARGADPADAQSEAETDDSTDDDAPLSDLAERLSERREKRTGEATDDPFEEMSIPEIDGEALWEAVGVEGEDRSPGAGPFADTAATPLDDETDDPEHVVEKETYCQKCPHLADPPELACTHDGTEIVEVVDSERFRVRNCPMVEE
ncbi:hypothetical protein [Halobellus rufus]|uniref:hypothetical protein n=1 Tax=Halobellus rufus TaxID=1448860 RepID=UPI000678517D|nr:hypothetical protein [Halobellus rufus]